MDEHTGACCHGRGDELDPFARNPESHKMSVNSAGDVNENHFVECNIHTQKISEPERQLAEPLKRCPCGLICTGKCGESTAEGELNCHSPTCPHVVRSTVPADPKMVQTGHSSPAPDTRSTHSRGSQRPRESRCIDVDTELRRSPSDSSQAPPGSSRSYTPNVQVDKDFSLQTPHSKPASREEGAVQSPHLNTTPLCKHGEQHAMPVNHPEDHLSNIRGDTSSMEFVSCAKHQEPSGSDRSVAQSLDHSERLVQHEPSPALEICNDGMKPNPSSSTPDVNLIPQDLSDKLSNKPKDQYPVLLNHLSFKDKQLVLSAVRKASCNMSCAVMLQERDQSNSGSVKRRDFQTVMDKIGVLKDISSRELEAVYKAFPANSETEIDYNKFLCACREYKGSGMKRINYNH